MAGASHPSLRSRQLGPIEAEILADSVHVARVEVLARTDLGYVVAISLILPWTPLGAWFGLVQLPFYFYLFLVAAAAAYLVLVEVVKRLFYRYVAPS